MPLLNVKPKRWTLDEYESFFIPRAGELPLRVELIEGEIVEMPSQNMPHGSAIMRSTNYLVTHYGDTHYVRVQLPLNLSHWSQPEPDFALVAIESVAQATAHPERADLIIEVSDTSLKYDLCEKASLYAKAGMPEYWVLDVNAQVLHRHRTPRSDDEQPFGFQYAEITVHRLGEVIRAAFRPQVEIEISRLF